VSPVSRGRRGKVSFAGSAGRATARTTVVHRPPSTLPTLMAQLGSPSERGQWFDQGVAAVLDQAHVVPEAQHPQGLERLTYS
jgi:hypothetical protein